MKSALMAVPVVLVIAWPAARMVESRLHGEAADVLRRAGQDGLSVRAEGRDLWISGRAGDEKSLLRVRAQLAALPGAAMIWDAATVESARPARDPVELAPVDEVIAAPLPDIPAPEPLPSPTDTIQLSEDAAMVGQSHRFPFYRDKPQRKARRVLLGNASAREAPPKARGVKPDRSWALPFEGKPEGRKAGPRIEFRLQPVSEEAGIR